eukprot:COSAG01_NODE_50390_length_363_cov_9.511364_1_plen_37_part_10
MIGGEGSGAGGATMDEAKAEALLSEELEAAVRTGELG